MSIDFDLFDGRAHPNRVCWVSFSTDSHSKPLIAGFLSKYSILMEGEYGNLGGITSVDGLIQCARDAISMYRNHPQFAGLLVFATNMLTTATHLRWVGSTGGTPFQNWPSFFTPNFPTEDDGPIDPKAMMLRFEYGF